MAQGAAKPDAARARNLPAVHLLVRLEVPNKAPREFSYDFRQEVISVGRDPGNDIQIPLTTVSRRHARIFYELGDFFLEDLGSTHGTQHNGKRLGVREKRLLRDGDQISMMTFRITFKTSMGSLLDRQPGEKTEALARRMVQEVLSSLGSSNMEPPSLRVMDGADEGRRLEIQEDQAEITLGRSPECDFVLNDQNISRRHGLIKRTWNGFTIQDLGSKNGVLINGTRAEGAQPIKDGDEIQIGGIKMIFIDPASRILDQFGVFQDDSTATPEGADAAGEGPSGGDEADEQQEESEREDAGGEDPGADVEPPVEDDEDGDAPEEPDLSGPPPELIGVPKTGSGAEVAILVVGALFLVFAVGLAIFLYL